MGLLHEIIVKKGGSSYTSNGSVKAALEPFADTAKKLGFDPELFAKVAADLWAHRGESLVVAGGIQTTISRKIQRVASCCEPLELHLR